MHQPLEDLHLEDVSEIVNVVTKALEGRPEKGATFALVCLTVTQWNILGLPIEKLHAMVDLVARRAAQLIREGHNPIRLDN